MLSFVRINDPYRLMGVFFLLILIRIPFFINTDFSFVPELKWMLLGEKLAGGKLLYKQVWDTTEPFSAVVYTLLHLLFGKSILVYRIVSLILAAFYSTLFSKILIENSVFIEKTYVSAAVFGILTSLYFDFFTVSPPLLGLPFILLSVNLIFKLLEKGLSDHQYYNVGFLIGIAALFYLPYAFFLLFALTALIFFATMSIRRLLLAFLGFSFPYLILVIFYSLYYGLESVYYMYFVSWLTIGKIFYTGLENQVILIIIPLFFVILSFGKLLMAPRFINYQQKTQRLMILYLICAFGSFLLTTEIAPSHIIVFIPGFTFFITHYFLLIRRRFLAELMFFIFLGGIFIVCLGAYFKLFPGISDYSDLIVKTPGSASMKNKKVLILGDDISGYLNNSAASPYLNWNLSKNHFDQLSYFEVVMEVEQNLKQDLPQVIIDDNKVIGKLFDKIPSLSKRYTSCGENAYCLK